LLLTWILKAQFLLTVLYAISAVNFREKHKVLDFFCNNWNKGYIILVPQVKNPLQLKTSLKIVIVGFQHLASDAECNYLGKKYESIYSGFIFIQENKFSDDSNYFHIPAFYTSKRKYYKDGESRCSNVHVDAVTLA
jgi:hypothetical protein